MPDKSLTAAERKRLFALLIVAMPVTNREMREQTGLELERGVRERLNELKLVETHKRGQAYVNELTEDGWGWCKRQMTAPLPARDPGGKPFQALLNALDRYLDRSETPLSEVFHPAPSGAASAVGSTSPGEILDVDERIRAAYGELAPGPGAYIRLTQLRRHLKDVVQADLDAALQRLNGSPGVVIVPDSDQRGLTPADRAAAVRIGGEDRHLLKVGVS